MSDEIHCDLIRKDAVQIPLSRINPDERIITCTAASKSFNLAGMQTSNIIIKSEETRTLWKEEIMDRCSFMGSNPLGIVATEAAYTKGGPWLEQVNEYIDANLSYVGEFLAEHLTEAAYRKPQGTYFAWIDLRKYGYSTKQLEHRMQQKAGVLLDEGYIFGEEGAGFERINVACPCSILHECLVRMKGAILAD